jgi:hypothetical protein
MNTDFDDWMNKVEEIVFKELKMHLSDLPDENYRYHFENGKSAMYMAQIVINDNNMIFY